MGAGAPTAARSASLISTLYSTPSLSESSRTGALLRLDPDYPELLHPERTSP
ncbi:hypothetical protein [Nesterenkonia pannonica]|uniref:hypothetical protein n=1 Tax=Nesterenkonia pannonica TaxID=1548602 RepID=UPI002164E1B0|nr:hypothetical protein [Nesterenkonia pannonica]